MKKFPNNIVYKKAHLIASYKGTKSTSLGLYTTGLRLKSNCHLSHAQLEASRRVLVRLLRPKEQKNKKNLKLIHSARKKTKRKIVHKAKRSRFLLIRSNLVNPLSKKPLQTRMGKGKGIPYAWTSVKKSTSILLEMSRRQHNLTLIRKLFTISAFKLPVKTKFIYSKAFTRRESNFNKKKVLWFKGY